MTKLCPVCNAVKDESEFYLRQDTANKNLRRRVCKECIKEKQRTVDGLKDPAERQRKKQEYYQQHRADVSFYNHELTVQKRKLIAEEKQKPCTDCGREYHPCVMDFDHVPGRGQKVAAISRMMNGSYSIASVEAELKKCDLVCANCHRLRTHRREYTRDFARPSAT